MAKIKPAADMNGQGNIKSFLTPTEKPKTARKAPAGSVIQNNSAKVSSDGVVKKPNKVKAAKTVAKKSGIIEASFKHVASKTKSAVSKAVDDPVEDPTGQEESVKSAESSDTPNFDDEWESDDSDEEDDENTKEVTDEILENPRSIPKPKRDKWKKHDTPDKNGRCVGRQLVMWHRPRMMEKMLLHIQYECQRANIALPWEKIVHRLMPGSSGPSACQHLAKVRKTLLREGHLVPPLIGKLGTAQDSNIRGYMRDTPDGPDRMISWTEDIEDRKVSLVDDIVRGSGRYRQVEVEVKRQAKLELEKTLKKGGNEAVIKVLREAAQYKHNPTRKHDGNQARRHKAEEAKTLASPEDTKDDSQRNAIASPTNIASPTKKHTRTRGMSGFEEISSEVDPLDLDSDDDYCPTPTKRPRTSAVRKSTRTRKTVKVECVPELSEEEQVPATTVEVNTVANSTPLKHPVVKTSIVIPASPAKLDMAATSKELGETPVKTTMSKQPAVSPENALAIAISATLKKSTSVPETTVKAAILPATLDKSTATTLKKSIAVPETPTKRTSTVGKKLAVVPTTLSKKQAATVGPRKSRTVKTFIGKMPASAPRKTATGSDPSLAHLITGDVKQAISTVVPGDEIVDGNKQTVGNKGTEVGPNEVFAKNSYFEHPGTDDPFKVDSNDPFSDKVFASVAANTIPLKYNLSGQLQFPPFLGQNSMSADYFGPPEEAFALVGHFNESDIFSPTRHVHARFNNYASQSSIAPTTSQVSEQTLVHSNLGFDDNFAGYAEQYSISPSPVIDPNDPIDMFMQ